MVGASIPTLRPLLRKRQSPSGTPNAYPYPNQSRRKDYAKDPYSMPPDSRVDSTSRAGHDGGSEEYILESFPAAEDQQITKTTEVHFAYEKLSEATIHGSAHGIINAYQRDLIRPWTGPGGSARPSGGAGG